MEPPKQNLGTQVPFVGFDIAGTLLFVKTEKNQKEYQPIRFELVSCVDINITGITLIHFDKF